MPQAKSWDTVTQAQYCDLYHSGAVNHLAPTMGTLIDGSQRSFESVGNSFAANIDYFDWTNPSLQGNGNFHKSFFIVLRFRCTL